MFLHRHTPLPYQIEGVEFALSKPGCIIGDEMGLGKTIQAIGVINSLRAFPKVLVICPAVSKYSWAEEIEAWRTYPYAAQVIESKTGCDVSVADVTIINYDILHKFQAELKSITWDLIVADEFHYLRNSKSKRSKVAFALQTKRRVYLSGTPIPNKIKNLWAPLRSISPTWGEYMAFTKRYCGGHFQWMCGRREWWAEGAANLEELHHKIQPYMIRRLAKDVLDLPPLTSSLVRIPPGCQETELADMIAKLAKELLDSGKEIPVPTSMKPGSMGKEAMAEYRKQAGDTKLPHAISRIREVIKTQKIVVFAYHRHIAKAIYEEFRDHAVLVIGGTPSKSKKAAADRFNKDPECKVFVGNIESAGVTLTLTSANRMLFVEHDWQPVSVMQAAKRCHRIGQTRPVHVEYLVLDDSIDVQMAMSIDRKVRNMQVALDGVEPSWAELIFERDDNDTTGKDGNKALWER